MALCPLLYNLLVLTQIEIFKFDEIEKVIWNKISVPEKKNDSYIQMPQKKNHSVFF